MPTPPRRSDRWFLLACAFLLVNTWGIWRLSQSAEPSGLPPGAAGLVDASPTAQTRLTDRTPLEWTFATDMAEVAGDLSVSNAPPVELIPPTDGRWRWASPRQLIFVPDQPWSVGQITESFPVDGALDQAGRPITRFQRRWLGQPLQVESIRQLSLDNNGQARIEVRFNAPIDTGRIRSFLKITTPEDEAMSYRISRSEGDQTVILRTEAVDRDRLHIHIADGLRPRQGSLGLTQAVEQELFLTGELQLGRLEAQSDSDGAYLYCEATLPVDPGLAARHVSIVPPVDITVEQRSYQPSTLLLKGDFQPGTRYEVTWKAGLPAAIGGSLASNLTYRVTIPDHRPDIGFADPGNYLSSAGNRQVVLKALNVTDVEVRASRVLPQNLHQFALRKAGRSRSWGSDDHLLSRPVGKQTRTLPVQLNETQHLAIDLDELGATRATGAWIIEADSPQAHQERRLVVISDIGLHARHTRDGLAVWARSLRTCAPLAHIALTLYNPYNQSIAEARTDDGGYVFLPIPERPEEEREPFLLVAQQGEDATFIQLDNALRRTWSNQGTSHPEPGAFEAFLFSERGIYRPGEPGMAKVVVRNLNGEAPPPHPLRLRVRDKEGRVVRELTETLSDLGTAHWEWTWDTWLPTGRYSLEVGWPGHDQVIGRHTVSLEDFVPPQVAATFAPDRERGTLAAPPTFALKARHLYGAPAADLPVEVVHRLAPMAFSHSNWEGFVFVDNERDPVTPGSKHTEQLRLDENGSLEFTPELQQGWQPRSALQVSVYPTLLEPSGRPFAVSASAMIDAYPHYTGLRPPKGGRVDEPVQVDLARVHPDGTGVTDQGDLQITVDRITHVRLLKKEGNRFRRVSERQLERLTQASVPCTDTTNWSFTPPHPGRWLVRAWDPSTGHAATTEISVSGNQAATVAPQTSPRKIELKLVEESVSPGGIATLEIEAPFTGPGLLTVEDTGLRHQQSVTITSTTQRVSLPIPADWQRSATVTLTVWRPLEPGIARPAWRAYGGCALRIKPDIPPLSVAIDAPEVTLPAAPLTAKLTVERDGQPVAGAEVFVGIVDEGILGLTNYQSPDPRAWFLRQRRHEVSWFDLYDVLLPERDQDLKLEMLQSATGGGGGGLLRHRLNPVNARRFKSTALWVAAARTDSNGVARVSVDMPEFTGSVRLTAVAVGGESFGQSQAHTAVRRPVVVTASLPRFLAPGDTADCPIWLHNTTDQPRPLQLALGTSGPLTCTPEKLDTILQPGERRAWRFQATAATEAGKAEWKLEAQQGQIAWQELIELAVRPVSGPQLLARTQTLPPGEKTTISTDGTWMQGTLHGRVVADTLPALHFGRDLADLLRYPYGCAEQTASGILPLLRLGALAEAVDPGRVPPGTVTPYIRDGLRRLQGLQQHNGGVGWWPGSDDPDPFVSLYVGFVFADARASGQPIPDGVIDRSTAYASRVLNGRNLFQQEDRDRTARALAAAVLSRAGTPDIRALFRLREEEEKLNPAARAWTAMGFALAGERDAARKLLEPLSPTVWNEVESDQRYLFHSQRRDQALALGAWGLIDPSAEAVDRLLIALKQQPPRTWTTQENAWLWWSLGLLGDRSEEAGEAAFTLVRGDETITTNQLASVTLGDGAVEVRNEGEKKVYLFINERGVPLVAPTDNLDQGVKVRRRLLDRNGQEIDLDQVPAGSTVVVELIIDPATEFSNGIIDDLLPAGLEIENPRLYSGSPLVNLPNKSTLPVRHWEARDDRMIVFLGHVSGEGVYRYTTRAVTPGRYVLPAVQAESMYQPGQRSRHGAGTLQVVKP